MLVFAPLPPAAAGFLGYGFIGVTFFFVLSGFVLTWSSSPTVRQSTFYWRRFARVYPSHLVALALAIPVFYGLIVTPTLDWVKPPEPAPLLLSTVLLQGWSSDPDVLFSGNPAAWTLTCEMFFYALHPYLALLLRRAGVRAALVTAAGVAGLAFAYRGATAIPGTDFLGLVPLPIVHLPEFVVGMAVAWAFRCGWRPRIRLTFGLGAIAVVLALVVLVPHYAAGSVAGDLLSRFAGELFTVAFAVSIAAFAASDLAGRRTVFRSRPIVLLGEWSYAFYLVHATFVYLALAAFGRMPASWSNLGWFALLFLIAIGGAAALHYGVERPVERRLRRWKDARDLRAQT
jgi:peptidoglycan/LPS O-acetylase OafA/YrhL